MKLNINGYNVNIEEINPSGRETVFFIHGWPLSHKMFEYQWRALADAGIRCIGLDLIGYGASDKPWNIYDYNTMSEILDGVLTQMRLKGITLLGYSMGGAIAARYISRYGRERVKKLILLAAACPVFTRRPDFPYGTAVSDVNALINNLINDKPKTLAGFTNNVFTDDISAEFAGWFGNIAGGTPLWSAETGLIALRDEDLRQDLERIEIPAAIFHGVKDKICPFELAEQMRSRIKKSFIVPFENSGHGLFYEERDKLNAAILDFVAGGAQPKMQKLSAAQNSGSTGGEGHPVAPGMNEHYKFVNVPLPFGFGAMEPFIDAKTMELHHDRHLQTYIDNLNAALEKYPQLHDWPLERLIYYSQSLPPDIRVAVENNAGGVYNHFFYFDQMLPPGSAAAFAAPGDGLMQRINARFGSFDGFKQQFTAAAMSVFGSGYAWLTENKNRELEIITTANQSTPVTLNKLPLLNIDVWEHAYYLKHYNKRAAYIADWFNTVNWAVVEKRMQ